MQKYFTNYNQSLALKELGYDEPCMGKYDTNQGDEWFLNIYSGHLNIQFSDKSKACIAPLKSQVFEWFRKEHHLFGRVYPITVGGFANGEVPKDWQPEFLWEIYKPVGVRYYPKDNIVVKIEDNLYKSWYSYEEAESACIDKLIEIVKTK